MRTFDRTFLLATGLLVIIGFFVFTSASLGLLARPDGARFSSVAFHQVFFGIGLGSIALLVLMNVRYRFWRKYSFYLFILALLATCLVFIPGLGFSSGGATRWIHIGNFSWQPAEFLKLAYVLYIAALLSGMRSQIQTFRGSILPFSIITALAALPLLLQPDTGTTMVLAAGGLAILIAAGCRMRHLAVLFAIVCLLVAFLAYTRPYVKDRIITFLDPGGDPRGSSYKLQQSLIAIGSGGLTGRGFGQSVQKFNYLPEPIGDSIFAVAAEEFGFLGAVTLIGLFLYVASRGLKIAARAPDSFGRLSVVGIVILIVSQSFINIASMVGLVPLTGLPMLFVSHGGTALFFALAEVGIILNISRYAVQK